MHTILKAFLLILKQILEYQASYLYQKIIYKAFPKRHGRVSEGNGLPSSDIFEAQIIIFYSFDYDLEFKYFTLCMKNLSFLL